MDHVIVVGSGASGVHFALSLLERGHRVTMVDGGKRGSNPPHPDATYTRLKERLDDPARHLLGEDFSPLETLQRHAVGPGKTRGDKAYSHAGSGWDLRLGAHYENP